MASKKQSTDIASAEDTAGNPPAALDVATESALLHEKAKSAIKTAQDYVEAAETLKHITGAIKRLNEKRLEITRPLDTSKSLLMEVFRPWQERLDEAKTWVLDAIAAYDEAQVEQARIAQAAADEVARKAQEKLQAQATKAETSGKVEKAAELQQRASMVVAPVFAPAPRPAGLASRENWKAECNDLSALVLAAAATIVRAKGGLDSEEVRKLFNTSPTVPLAFLLSNDKVLAEQARSLKVQFVCPGVRVFSDKTHYSKSA